LSSRRDLLLLLQLRLRLLLFVLRRHPERSEGPLYLSLPVLCRYCLSGSWIELSTDSIVIGQVLRAVRMAL
jgi:hypothetical protein